MAGIGGFGGGLSSFDIGQRALAVTEAGLLLLDGRGGIDQLRADCRDLGSDRMCLPVKCCLARLSFIQRALDGIKGLARVVAALLCQAVCRRSENCRG